MGFLKSLFKSKTPPAATYEIVEKHLSIDDRRYQVRIKKAGRELYVEDLFQTAKKPRDLTFGRFFLLNENPPKPHFAPSLDEAMAWFTGQGQPKDGYGTIFWGEQVAYECSVCRRLPEVAPTDYPGGAPDGGQGDPHAHGNRRLAGGGGGVGVDRQGDAHPETGGP